jgi:hypothetical protein
MPLCRKRRAATRARDEVVSRTVWESMVVPSWSPAECLESSFLAADC